MYNVTEGDIRAVVETSLCLDPGETENAVIRKLVYYYRSLITLDELVHYLYTLTGMDREAVESLLFDILEFVNFEIEGATS